MALTVSQVVQLEPLFAADKTDPLAIWFARLDATGDASGGLLTMDLLLPVDFVLTCTTCSVFNSSATAKAVTVLLVTGGRATELYLQTTLMAAPPAGTQGGAVFDGMRFGPFSPVTAATLEALMTNVLNETSSLVARGFVFDKSLFRDIPASQWSRFIPA